MKHMHLNIEELKNHIELTNIITLALVKRTLIIQQTDC